MAASPSNPLVLYDLRQAAGPLTFSPNVFKTKLVLHYKQIPYRTIPLYGSKIKSVLRPLGVKPTWHDKRGRGIWTVPSIIDPGTSAPTPVAESRLIASYLDSAYPSSKPVLPPIGAAWSDRHEALIRQFQNNVLPQFARLVVPCSMNLYDESEAKMAELRLSPILFSSKPFAEAYVDPAERAQLWALARSGMDELAAMYEENAERSDWHQLDGGKPGVYAFGSDPTFADMVLIAHFSWLAAVPSQRDPGLNTCWDEVRTWNGGRWDRMAEAFDRDYGCQSPKLAPISYGGDKSTLARL